MSKHVLIAALTPFILIIALGGCARKPVRDIESLKRIIEEMREQNRSACVKGCILFEGDSNIELIKVQDYFPTPACNYAYRGSTTGDLLGRREKVRELQPRAIVLLAGGNDLVKSVPLGQIDANYASLIRYYRGICKKVYCVSNLPVHPGIFITNDDMQSLNLMLAKRCRQFGAVYIDVFPLLYRDGGLNPDYALDLVHLNEAGRNVMMEEVKRHLK